MFEFLSPVVDRNVALSQKTLELPLAQFGETADLSQSEAFPLKQRQGELPLQLRFRNPGRREYVVRDRHRHGTQLDYARRNGDTRAAEPAVSEPARARVPDSWQNGLVLTVFWITGAKDVGLRT